MAGLPKGSSGRSALEIAQEAVRSTGRVVAERFYGPKKVTFKGPSNPVTDVDELAEMKILSFLREEFPDFGFLGEESVGAGEKVGSGYVWIVDPIDGTRNYVAGIPFFSMVIGLVCDGDVLLGVNYDPMRDEMFTAAKGKGAFLNGRPITISKKTAIEQCIIGLDLSYNSVGAMHSLKVVESIWPGMQSARIMGSSALGTSYAAAGRIDLYFHHRLAPWDIVAGLLLVKEAGGVITDRNGGIPSLYPDGLAASNAILHAEFMKRTEGMEWRRFAEITD